LPLPFSHAASIFSVNMWVRKTSKTLVSCHITTRRHNTQQHYLRDFLLSHRVQTFSGAHPNRTKVFPRE